MSGVWSILVVDDEPVFRKTLQKSLAAGGHNVDGVSSGGDAVDLLSQASFEFVLLDLNMPGMGGLLTCRMIRTIAPRTGIVVLSVRNEERDRVEALDAGADDYLTKPFGLSELAARLGAIHRRVQTEVEPEAETLKYGEVEMDLPAHLVWRAGKTIHLTPKEFEILAYLMKHEGHPVSHVTLLRTIWGPAYGDEAQYLRNYVRALREKLETNPERPRYIVTEPRIGYRFCNPENADIAADAWERAVAAIDD
jgi:two-component system KDP operon response regulator KdpE